MISLFGEFLKNSLPFIVSIAVEIISILAASLLSSENLEMLLQSAFAVISALVGAFFDNLSVILNAALQIIAFLCEALLTEENITALVNAAVLILQAVITALVENLPLLLSAAIQLVTFLCSSLLTSETVSLLLESAVSLLMALIKAITDNTDLLLIAAETIIYSLASELMKEETLRKVFELGGMLLKELIIGLGTVAGHLAGFVERLLEEAKLALADEETEWIRLGEWILEGILSGLLGVDFDFASYFDNFADNWLTGIKDVFGIHSPSKLMRDEVGKYLALGISEGFAKNMPNVRAEAEQALEALNHDLPELTIRNQANSIETPDFKPDFVISVPEREIEVSLSDIPEIGVPDLETEIAETIELVPEMTEIPAIPENEVQISAPEISIQIQEPEIENPELVIDTPQLPEIENPELVIDTPEFPEIENPELVIDTPEFPEIENPELVIDTPEFPEIENPELAIDTPKFPLEKIPTGGISFPEMPVLDVPEIGIHVPDIRLPEIQLSPEAVQAFRVQVLRMPETFRNQNQTSETINNHYSYTTTNSTNQQNISQNAPSGDIIIPVSVGGQQLETLVISAIQIENARSGGRTV